METILVILEASHCLFPNGDYCKLLKCCYDDFKFVFQGAFAVAMLNIQIPQIVGSVINVLAKFNDTKDSGVFFSEMKLPAFKLISVYVAQVRYHLDYYRIISHYIFLVCMHLFLYIHVVKYRRKDRLPNENRLIRLHNKTGHCFF